MQQLPSYMNGYEELWSNAPRSAHRHWFACARFGLFIHYGLYSQLGRGEWVQYFERIPVAEYERLASSFSPDRFNADAIADLAVAAGMKYICFTACHHDGFCLWNSATEPFNSYAASGRDMVRELAKACARKGLGFFIYYTHVLNWRSPYSLPREILPISRPDYPLPDPAYELTDISEYPHYWEYAHRCLSELLALEYPITGIWLDIIVAYYHLPDIIPVERTYSLIREKRPEALISFKQGATGDEDYASPEFHFNSMADRMRKEGDDAGAVIAENAWRKNSVKHNEICMTLQDKGWGYVAGTRHYTAREIRGCLAYALSNNCNLLANTGLLPDGSVHESDERELLLVGESIRRNGWPGIDEIELPRAHGAHVSDTVAAAAE